MHLRLGIIPMFGMLIFAGCGSGEGGGGSGVSVPPPAPPAPAQKPVVRVTQITVEGALSEAATVTVAGAADQDGKIDAAYRVALALDGSAGAGHLPSDAAGWEQTLRISARDADSNTAATDLEVRIAP